MAMRMKKNDQVEVFLYTIAVKFQLYFLVSDLVRKKKGHFAFTSLWWREQSHS